MHRHAYASLNRVQGVPVNQDNSQDGRSHVDSSNNGSVQKSRVGTITQDIKQLSGVEHDGVDTGELLEEGDEDSSSLQGTQYIDMSGLVDRLVQSAD